MKGKLYIVNGL